VLVPDPVVRAATAADLPAAAALVGAQRVFASVGFRPTMVEMTRERGASH